MAFSINTKYVLTASAALLGAAGLILTFDPEVLLSFMGVESTKLSLLLVQMLGSLYFAFAMLNWMSKGSITGGIYNRPLVVANTTHFCIAGLALIKVLLSTPALPPACWITGIIYLVFAAAFGALLFQHPSSGKNESI
ncbi:MAG TPA: hypothetical protein VGO45_05285 [Bacteroidia bacterium]|jgi:hypothetical protein|nr:hypothetical protein [Bacteroidia bacterium]